MITIVSGFQRCGTSLLLQMLSAGGMPVFSDPESGYPAFETMRIVTHAADPTWLEAIDGQAVKWLEPFRTMPPMIAPELRVIWMTRNHRQQSKSAVKFMRDVGGMILPSGTAKAFQSSYRRDEARARAAWERRGELMVLPFEFVLSEPERMAGRVRDFLDHRLDVDKMAAEVRPRGPECLDGCLELDLIRQREARA